MTQDDADKKVYDYIWQKHWMWYLAWGRLGYNPELPESTIRQAYIDHYAHVRAVVPKDNLLEFRSKDGWEPLCKFLGKPVPEGSYPHINDAKAVLNLHHFLWWAIIVRYVFWNSLKVGMPVAGAWMYYRYTR